VGVSSSTSSTRSGSGTIFNTRLKSRQETSLALRPTLARK
jgi:hypothetical protein